MNRLSQRVVPIVLLLLVFILLQAPATLIYLTLQSRLPDLQVSAMAGTVWRGSAVGVAASVGGKAIAISQLGWQLRPWSVFLLRPGMDFQASQDGQTFSGSLHLSLRSGWQLNDTTLELPLARLGHMSTLPLDGFLQIDLDSLVVSDHRVTDIEGRMRLRDAALVIAEKRFLLGDLAAELEPSGDGGVRAIFASSNAKPIGLSGELSLNAAGNYQLETVVALGDETMSDLEQLLPLLGESLGGRQYRLVFASSMR